MRVGAALFALALGACSSLTSQPAYDQPSLTPLTVCAKTDPPKDSAGKVFRDAVVLLDFGAYEYPDPDTVGFGSLLLRSGPNSFDVDTTVDLVDRTVRMRPRSPLAPDTRYEIVIAGDVRSLSGRRVGATMGGFIDVGSGFNPSPSPAPAPVRLSDGLGKALSQCAPVCHTPDGCAKDSMRNPTSNLDLTKPYDPMVGLVNVPSVELAGTQHPMLRVAPGDSARSVLLRKLLGGDPLADTQEPPTGDMGVPANLGVPGRRMPLHETACGLLELYWTDEKIRTVQTWIDQGAH